MESDHKSDYPFYTTTGRLDLCKERGIDIYKVLGEILRYARADPYELAPLNTESIIRALRREHNILVSYKHPRVRSGRPSKIARYIDGANRWGKETALREAKRELKPRTYYRLKKRLG